MCHTNLRFFLAYYKKIMSYMNRASSSLTALLNYTVSQKTSHLYNLL